jgi:hypothetical protein
MTKVKRDHTVFKSFLLKDPPATSVRQPCDNVFKLGVGKNEMKLDREGRFLRSDGHGLSNQRGSLEVLVGENVRKVTVSAGTFLLARAGVVDTSVLATGRIIANISRGVHMHMRHAHGPRGEHDNGVKPGLELLGKGG